MNFSAKNALNFSTKTTTKNDKTFQKNSEKSYKTSQKNSQKSCENVKKSQKNSRKFTKISSGIFKGQSIILPSFETTRSTKSAVRACVFSTLRYELGQSAFVEVFAGSALMMIEALSNNAKSAIGIEKDKNAFQIASKNVDSINQKFLEIFAKNSSKNLNENSCENLSENAHPNPPLKLYFGDSFELLPNIIKACQSPVIAYFDPPFHFRDGFESVYDRVFELIKSLKSTNLWLFVLEHSSQITTPQQLTTSPQTIKAKKTTATSQSAVWQPPIFSRFKIKKFGNTSLSFYKKA